MRLVLTVGLTVICTAIDPEAAVAPIVWIVRTGRRMANCPVSEPAAVDATGDVR